MYIPERNPNPFFVAKTPDPGLNDFLFSNSSTALYHSPFMGIYRAAEMWYSELGGEDINPTISAGEATERFGLDGALKFDSDIKTDRALLMYHRKIAETEREDILSSGNTGAGRMLAGFGVGMASTIVDPINLASMFVPIVSEARYARLLQKTGGTLWKARAVRGVLEGSVGAAMVEPFILLPAVQEQANFGLKDSAINIGLGGVMAGLLHVGGGALGDALKVRKTGSSVLVDGLNDIKKKIDGMNPDDQDAMMRSAITDILQDDPVSSPADIMGVSDKIVADQVRFDSAEARKTAVTELGFDVEQPETFKLYPDKSIADPKPNEPWFHGRRDGIEGDIEFEKGMVGWFTRDVDHANGFGDTFAANLDVKNPASADDLSRLISRISSEDPELTSITSERLMEADRIRGNLHMNLEDLNIVKELRDMGFDSYLGHELKADILVVFDPDTIKTPGIKAKKTKTGVVFDDPNKGMPIEQRVQKLKKSRINNLVEQKRRAFKKQQALAQQEIKIETDDPMTLKRPVADEPDIELRTLEDQIASLEETFGARTDVEIGDGVEGDLPKAKKDIGGEEQIPGTKVTKKPDGSETVEFKKKQEIFALGESKRKDLRKLSKAELVKIVAKGDPLKRSARRLSFFTEEQLIKQLDPELKRLLKIKPDPNKILKSDSFTMYPDKSIPDPRINEVWFHGRSGPEFEFRDGVTYFSRDTDLALAFGDDDANKVFAATLEMRNPMNEKQLIQVGQEFGQGRLDKSKHGGLLPDLGGIPSILDNPDFVDFARSKGFDSFVGSHNLGEVETGIMAVMFNSDNISEFGVAPKRSKKTQLDFNLEEQDFFDNSIRGHETGTETAIQAAIDCLVKNA